MYKSKLVFSSLEKATKLVTRLVSSRTQIYNGIPQRLVRATIARVICICYPAGFLTRREYRGLVIWW